MICNMLYPDPTRNPFCGSRAFVLHFSSAEMTFIQFAKAKAGRGGVGVGSYAIRTDVFPNQKIFFELLLHKTIWFQKTDLEEIQHGHSIKYKINARKVPDNPCVFHTRGIAERKVLTLLKAWLSYSCSKTIHKIITERWHWNVWHLNIKLIHFLDDAFGAC